MTWARLDDTFPAHRKVRRLSDAAFRLHITAICYAAHDLTDGLITADDLADMVIRGDPEKRIAELVQRGAWDEIGPDAWRIHDYLDYNPSRAQVMGERAASRERQRKRREQRIGHGVTNGVTPPEVTRESQGVSQHPDPTRPDPTRPSSFQDFSSSSSQGDVLARLGIPDGIGGGWDA